MVQQYDWFSMTGSSTSMFNQGGFPIMSLPIDILLEIFSYIPASRLFCLRSLSKQWRSVIDAIGNGHFQNCRVLERRLLIPYGADYSVEAFDVHGRSQYFELPYRRMEIKTSVNGLVLCTVMNRVYFIWNPLTGCYKKIPRNRLACSHLRGRVVRNDYGFAYNRVHNRDDYKLVQLQVLTKGMSIYPEGNRAYIWSSTCDMWELIDSFPNIPNECNIHDAHLNGFLHYLVKTKKWELHAYDTFSRRHDMLPELHFATLKDGVKLCVLGDKHLTVVHDSHCSIGIGLWQLQNDSWFRVVTVFNLEYLWPYSADEVMYGTHYRLNWHHLKENTVKVFPPFCRSVVPVPHVYTVASIRDMICPRMGTPQRLIDFTRTREDEFVDLPGIRR